MHLFLNFVFSLLFFFCLYCIFDSKNKKRVFKAVDPDECGYIPTDKLQDVLNDLDLPFANDANSVARLRGHLQIDGGIILWSTFWEVISKLVTGTSLEDLFILNQNAPGISGAAAATAMQPPPHLLQRQRSDSEIARELQAEFDSSGPGQQLPVTTTAASSSQIIPRTTTTTPNLKMESTPQTLDFSNLFQQYNGRPPAMNVVEPAASTTAVVASSRVRSDSDLARELQAQWDQEDNEPPPLLDLTSDKPFQQPNLHLNQNQFSPLRSNSPMVSEYKTPDRSHLHRNDSIADESAEGFEIFHFNALESHGKIAKLSKFILFPRFNFILIHSSINNFIV